MKLSKFLSVFFPVAFTVIVAAGPPVADDLNPYHEYEFAFKYFEQGDYSASMKIVNRLLKKDLDPLWKASYLVLQGNLLGKQRGQNEAAIASLEEARTLYQDQNNEAGLDVVALILAKHYQDANRLSEAEILLDKLDQPEAQNKGYLHFLYARLALQRQQYDSAMASANKAVAAYLAEDDKVGAAQTQSIIGLIYLLSGDGEKGFQATLDCQEAIVHSGDVDQYFYTLVNTILYQRCYRGQDDPATVRIVEARLDREYDSDLERLLELCREQGCP